ncbi:MAG: phenylacetic acid degradation bifunctional protein PaaZ [Albidovulum sp.]|nr:phenylacetic acid degradation bifunctional protein PaaZ [Albidovulum sp.]
MPVPPVQNLDRGKWSLFRSRGKPIRNPSNGEIIAEVAAEPPDFPNMFEFARRHGGPALRSMSIRERARMIKDLATELNCKKDRLYSLNHLTGATRKDGWYDIDGGIGTVFSFASKGAREMQDGCLHLDGDTERLSKKGTFVGRHIAVPRRGVAVHINAFNFPVWGMLEKLAPALLAGMPAIVKSASSTSYLAAECIRLIKDAGILPEGAVQFIAGNADGIANCLGPQDVLSFTGSSETAALFRAQSCVTAGGTKFIAEQDSLNASILGCHSEPGTPEFELFIQEALREITTKAGQKCTASRRLIIPRRLLDDALETLSDRLSEIVVGNPELEKVEMGPLVSMEQKRNVLDKVNQLELEASMVCGSIGDLEICGADPEIGAFFAPTILLCAAPDEARRIHEIEAFGPVSCIMPYRDAEHAAALANRGGGSLVASVFTNDPVEAKSIAVATAAWHGRLYFNNRESMKEATGHGSPLAPMIHGGPGRAGGGEELGGVRGVMQYMQRTAVQASPNLLAAISGQWVKGAARKFSTVHPFKRGFNELKVGDALTTDSRVVTERDIRHFAEFTGDKFYAHTDEAAAMRNPFFPGKVAHGYLLLSFAAGLFVDPEEGPVLANTGLSKLAFRKPVSPGESIRAELTVKRKTRRTDEYGEVRWHVSIENQDCELVAEYELRTFVAYRA